MILILFLISVLYGQVFDELPCSNCHTPETWTPLATVMTFDHSTTAFELTGQHLWAECIQCHSGSTIEEQHTFTSVRSECETCHLDVHFTNFGSFCDLCHNTTNWVINRQQIKHDQTLFPLSGAHLVANCEDCHRQGQPIREGYLTTECGYCHRPVFTNALGGDHPDNDDCIICHNTRLWLPVDMSHHDRLFPIYSGEHRGKWSTCEVECHIYQSDYTRFSCGLNGICHDHRRSEMDSEHLGEVSGYSYESIACFDCHPRGSD